MVAMTTITEFLFTSLACVPKKNYINNLATIQRRATRFILDQKRWDQSYGERLKQHNLMDLNNRRKYLSFFLLLLLLVAVFRIPVHLSLATGLFIHVTLIPCFLTIISLQRRIVLNLQLEPTSPVCGLSFQTQSGIILYYIASHLLKTS